MTRHALTVALAVALFAPGASAAPQTRTGPQTPAATAATATYWDLWAGCWTLTEETTDEGSSTIARLLGLGAPRTKGPGDARVCVTTDRPSTATFSTTFGDRPAISETIVADGSEQPLADAECRGWQRAAWSTLGPRLFASAEMTCGTQAPRKVSGLSMMMAGPTWIDIQMVESQGQRNLRVRRYYRAADGPAVRRTATPRLVPRLTFAEVKEASARVAPEVLQAALIELKGGFDLDSRRLTELADAGVSRGVIDLMVALSFPKKFVVERPVTSSGGGGGYSGGWSFDSFDPSWAFYSSPYLFTSYYAPFGYRYWGYYDNRYFTGPGFVVINPNGGGPTPAEPSGDGRVVDGRGYTRVRRADPVPVNSGYAGGLNTSSSSGSGSSGSSGSGSSGVSSSGYSGGGSGGGGDRTAQPRPPGL
jgi:hypothetical protein